jgi:hypothetical protein
MRLIIIAIASTILSSCGGNASAPKVVPGAGSAQIYDMMEEDSSEIKVDTTQAK